jgi:uncharacterized protein
MHRAAIVSIITLFAAITVTAQEPDRRTISTAGDATVYVTPDQADISLAVETYSDKLNEAKAANDAQAASAVAAIKALGIEAKQISTSDVSVSLDYDGRVSSHRQIIGYTVHRGYVVKVTDISLVSKVVDAALNNGANEIEGVTFNSTQLRKYRDEARKMAAKAAKEKAIDLAGVMDAAVGPVRTINENSLTVGNFWNGYNHGAMGANMYQNSTVQVGGDAGTGDETTPPGQIAIRASVMATFDLQDAKPIQPVGSPPK